MTTTRKARYSVRDQESNRLICRRHSWDSALDNARRHGRRCWIRDHCTGKLWRTTISGNLDGFIR